MRIFTTGFAMLLVVLAALGIYSQVLHGRLLLERPPLDEVQALAAEGRWQEASLWLEWITDTRPDLDDSQAARRMQADIEQSLRESRLTRFGKGMATGEADDLAGLAGSVTLDLFVLGDVRDLVVQSYKQASTGDGDMIIMALSGIGLATTAMPQIDWVAGMLKSFRRSGKFTRGFTKSLDSASRVAVHTGNFKPLVKIVGDSGAAMSRLGPAGFKGSLNALGDSADLARLAGASRIDPASSYILASKFGRKGLQKTGQNGQNVVQAAGRIKLMSRGAKILKKALPVFPLAFWIVLLAAAVAVLFRRRIMALPGRVLRANG